MSSSRTKDVKKTGQDNPTAATAPSSGKASKPSVNARTEKNETLTEYMKGVRSEWTKISWPTWPQIWAQSLVVVTMVSFFTVTVWVIDEIFRLIISFITPSY